MNIFFFTYVNEAGDLVTRTKEIDGGIIEAFEYAESELLGRVARSGVHVHQFNQCDQCGSVGSVNVEDGDE